MSAFKSNPFAGTGALGSYAGIKVIETPHVNGMLLMGDTLFAGMVPDEPPIYEQLCRDLGMKPLPPSKERRSAFNAMLIKLKDAA